MGDLDAFQPTPTSGTGSNEGPAHCIRSVGYSAGSCSSKPSEVSLSSGSGDLPTYEHIEFAHSGPDVSLGDPAPDDISDFDLGSVESLTAISIGLPSPDTSVGNIFSNDSDVPDAVAAAPQDTSGEQLNGNYHGTGSAGSEYPASSAVASQSSTTSAQVSAVSTLFEQGYLSPPITPPTPPHQSNDPGAPLTLTQAQQAYPTPPLTPETYTQLPTGYMAYEPGEDPSSDNRPRFSLFVNSVNRQLEIVFRARSQTAFSRETETNYEIPDTVRRSQSEPPSFKRDIVFVAPLTEEDFAGTGSGRVHYNPRYCSVPKRQRLGKS